MLANFFSIAFILSSFLVMADEQPIPFGTDVVECKVGESVSYELLELYEGKEIQQYTYNKMNSLKGLPSDEVFAGVMKHSGELAYGHSLKWEQYRKSKNPIIFRSGISIEGKDSSAIELRENCQVIRIASVFKDVNINKPAEELRRVVIDKDHFDRLDSLTKELVLLHSWLFYYAPLEKLSNRKIRIFFSKVFSDYNSGPVMNRVDLMRWSIAMGDSLGTYAVTDSDGQKWIYRYYSREEVERYLRIRRAIKDGDAYPYQFININGEKYDLDPSALIEFWKGEDGRVQIAYFGLESSLDCAKIVVNKKKFTIKNSYQYKISFNIDGSLRYAGYCSQHEKIPSFKGEFGKLFEYKFSCKDGAFTEDGKFGCHEVEGELKSGARSAVLYDRIDTSPLGPFQLSTPLLLEKEKIEIHEVILIHEVKDEILFSVKLSKSALIPYLNKDNGTYERVNVPAGRVVVLDSESRLIYVLRNEARNRDLNKDNYMTIDEYLLSVRPKLVLNCRYNDTKLNNSDGVYTFKISFSDFTVEIFNGGKKAGTGKIILTKENDNGFKTPYDFTIVKRYESERIVISKAKERLWVRDVTRFYKNEIWQGMSCK
jgi:hypothetical protein